MKKYLHLFRSVVVAAGIALSLPALAGPAVITFDTPAADAVASGVGFFNASQAVSSIAEDGFIYSVVSGSLFLSGGTGNPGNDMEGDGAGGGGVLAIVAQNGEPFQLQKLDFAAFDSRVPAVSGLSGTTAVIGLRSGSTVGADTFMLAAGEFSGGPGSFTPYTNWTTEPPASLANVDVDTLLITLNASNVDLGTGGSFSSWSAVDNITLAVPEPVGIALFGTMLAMLALLRQRRGRT